MVYCVAYMCKNDTGSGKSMHRFSKDKTKRKIWTEKVRRNPTDHSRYIVFVDQLIEAVAKCIIRLSIVNTGADPRDFSPEGGGGLAGTMYQYEAYHSEHT